MMKAFFAAAACSIALLCAAPGALAAQDEATSLDALYPGLPESRKIEFRAMIGDRDFGRHRLTFEEQEDGRLKVDVDIKLNYKILGISFYRYEHEGTGIWEDGNLVSFESETYNNGDDEWFLKASLNEDGETLTVDSSRLQADDVPLGIIPTTHWNRAAMSAERWMDSQHGEINDVTIEEVGLETIETEAGPIEATHYKINGTSPVSGPFDFELWYDENDRWVKCRFGKEGRVISYVLLNADADS